MAATLSETVVLAIRRLTRARFRRSFFSLAIVLVLLVFTVYLISFLPTGGEVSIKRPYKSPKVRLEEIHVEQLQNQIPKADLLQQDEVNAVAKPPSSSHYGDSYAWLDNNRLGNYESRTPVKKSRPGDGGRPYRINGRQEIDWDRAKSLQSQYGINIAVSEFIPMDRSVPDLRLEECKHWNYTEKLPSVSVVIIFHNEGLTTLMRTVHSVLVRSPQRFLKEVVLVDDFSDKSPLKKPLEDYIEKNFGSYKPAELSSFGSGEGYSGERLGDKSGKVRLIRNKERSGLIRSRSRGAQEAVGDVIVFLDAHCEVNYNWLPPLLAPIARDRKTLTVPIIDGIDSETFEYRPVYARNDQHYKGIWEWGLFYKELEVDMSEHLRSHKVSEPYDAPTHAGGLFAIDRQYFLELGAYDPGLLVWGGENFELSFKVWQCGGRLQWVPCSRVGHIYRAFMPYSFGSLASQRKGPLIMTNYKRVVEVWWDKKYREYFYTREPLARFYDAGDISEQLKIKNKLNCKSFDYFMQRVGKDVYKHFPQLPPNEYWGELRSDYMNNHCVDTKSSAPPQVAILSRCHGAGGNQLLRLNTKGQIGVGERCILGTNNQLTLSYCKLGTVDGPWQYDKETKQLKHKPNGKCLEYDSVDSQLKLRSCTDEPEQKFTWKTIRPAGF